MKRLLFIYNPHAGLGKVRGKLADILDAFTYQGYHPLVCATQGAGDGTALVKSLGGEFERVVCCGGDGTLHEVVAGLMDMPDPPVLGYIPAGTTNDFSRNLDLPLDMALAATVAVTGPTVRCDMGRFNGEPFVYVAAFGAFTDVSYGTPQKFKNMFGHLAYVLEGIGRLGAIRSRHLTIEHDGGTVEGDFIFGMASNTRSVGGFKGLPAGWVKLDDGLFEVVLVREPKSAADVQGILGSLALQNALTGSPVVAFHTAKLKLVSEEDIPWTLDGEFGGSHHEVTIQNCQKALRLARGEKH